jgi:hypothetical protein
MAMTAAEAKQAPRMVAAGTPLTEVAEVLGVSRTTLYLHLIDDPAGRGFRVWPGRDAGAGARRRASSDVRTPGPALTGMRTQGPGLVLLGADRDVIERQ